MISFDEFSTRKIKKNDIFQTRVKIFKNKSKNLRYLLDKRLLWMKPLLSNKKKIVELGSGSGYISTILKKKIILTDIIKYSWINKKIDMTKVNLGKKYLNKVDVFIINHSLHHCCNPAKSLKNMSKYLKKDGLILINDPELSFLFGSILFFLNDEE